MPPSRRDEFSIRIEDHGLSRKLEIARLRGINTATRRGVTKLTREAAKEIRAAAGEHALNLPAAAVRTSVKTNRVSGTIQGHAKPVWPYWLLSRGTKERQTKSGAGRGFIVPFDFVEQAARKIDPKQRDVIDHEISVELAKLGLLRGIR